MHVLVFDDDGATARLVARVAITSGLEAMAVTDAGAFRESLRTNPPQVVVLDLQLGDTDGVEQMRLLADNQYAGALVLMSGFDTRVLATARAVGQSLGLKVERVLEKPIRVTELEEIFKRLQSAGLGISAKRLMEAIANDELGLDFQPIVTREPKVLTKLEALMRWEHPVLGLIPPGQFLPMAESEVATIDALTDWVLKAALDAYQVLAELGISVPLSVNLSTRSLHDLTLPNRIEQRLRKAGMPARHLCLEITESAAFKDPARTMDVLSRMRLKGMQLSIDDFGIGYSSLRTLRQLPFSELKIDRSFICDVTTSRDSRAIVKSIIDLAVNMEMGCVAEGVETEETAQLLEQLGVRHLQGYLIARPMPVEAVPAWLATWTSFGSGMPHAAVMSTVQVPAASHGRSQTFHSSPVTEAAEKKSDVIRLPPRQLEVMRLLAEGHPVKVIAHRLNLGISTVKVHLALAYSALGAHNRTDAIRRAGPALLAGTTEQGPPS